MKKKLKIIIIIIMATSRYLPSLAEATMYVRGALVLEDVFPDGWTLRLGDGAEGLTPGVAAKREESHLPIRATQGGQDTKAVSEEHVYFLQKPQKLNETRPGALSRHLMVQWKGEGRLPC